MTQHLIQALETGGEEQAADLLRQVGGLGETARELAYRLYVICERKKWAKEALALQLAGCRVAGDCPTRSWHAGRLTGDTPMNMR